MLVIQDLINTQNDIEKHRVADNFQPQIEEAELIVARIVEHKWFSKVNTMFIPPLTFDASKLLNPLDTKRAKVYKALELAYLRLSRGANDESFYLKMEEYRKRYNDEVTIMLTGGISYDFNGSGDLQQKEIGVRSRRRTICR